MTLGDYIREVRRILRDATSTYWTNEDLTSYINQAMQERDRDTKMNRAFATVNTVVGQKQYALANLVPLYPDGTPAPGTVYDVMGVIYPVGNLRAQLGKVPYVDLASYYQPMVGYTNIPIVFTLYGAKFLLLAPAPNQVVPMEWDCALISPTLVLLTDADPLPDPWTEPVPWLACAYAKEEFGQSDEAAKYRRIYQQSAMSVGGSRYGMLPQPYTGISG